MREYINFVISIVISILFIASLTSAKETASQRKANLKPTVNSQTEGDITFERTKEGVEVKGSIKNLKPGEHGFHIHAKGDCTAPDASSAGDHFNPKDAKHGAQDAHERHAGDLGNITADESGIATFKFLDKHLELEGKNSIVGKSVIVHAKADDLKSQPSGDSGDRLACGVIM